MKGSGHMAKRATYKKQITSPELIAKINPENQKLVDKYMKNFATKRSPNSVNAYKGNFNIFFVWNLLYNDNKLFTDFKKIEMQEFFDFALTDLKWSPNRYAQVYSSISELSKFIEKFYDEKYPNFRNLMVFIEKMPKENVRKKSVFKKDELDRLLDWLGEKNKPNEQCLLALIMASGTRVSETLRFTTDMIDINHTAFEDLFLETTRDIKVKGRGVNGKEIPRYLIKDIFLPYYEKYLPIREKIMKEHGQEHNFIFINRDGTPAKLSTIRSWMEKWDKKLSQHWYPHAGRHFWTSYLIGIGLEKQLVQELQSWSSDALVDLYNDNTAKDVKWKGLAKLKAQLEKEKESTSNDDEDEPENPNNIIIN
jgi:site-specific recombinase XerD